MEGKGQYVSGELWRAKQLKGYKRTNGLYYGYGEKFTPQHDRPRKRPAQRQAMEIESNNEVLIDKVLDILATIEGQEDEGIHISLNALTGESHPKTLRLRALVGNQVMLMLLDSGSSHSFARAHIVL